MNHRLIFLALAAGALLVLPGCVANKQYRFVGDPVSPAFEGHTAEHPYQLSFIEFDEHGDYWDRRQLASAASHIKKSAKPVLLVEFIHGWHNDASEDAGDVHRFRCLLKQIGSTAGTQRLEVQGVYIGWRGESVARSPLLKLPSLLSLYSRKGAVERAAGHPMADSIFWLVREARKYKPGSRTVLIGHSLGALALEKVLAQSLPARLYTYNDDSEKGAGQNELYSPADLILLLNSAAESSYAKELIDTFRRLPQQPGEGTSIDPKHPLLISITSTADSATGTFFPIGTKLSNAFGVFRDYKLDPKFDGTDRTVNQKSYFTQTPGHDLNVVSHVVVPRHLPVRIPAGMWDETVGVCAVEQNPSFEENLVHPRGMSFVTGKPGEWDEWDIRPSPTQLGKPSAYWVMQVPKELIPSHGDIFNPNARSMMAALFRLNNEMKPAPPRKMKIIAE